MEWKKDLKHIHKQITENVNEKINVAKHEQDSRIRDVYDQLKVTISKTCEIETRTTVIAVSYTHLDVYKRQVYRHLIVRLTKFSFIPPMCRTVLYSASWCEHRL